MIIKLQFSTENVPWADRLRLPEESKLGLAKFVSITDSDNEKDLLITCSISSHVHIYDLDRRLRQVIDLNTQPCIQALEGPDTIRIDYDPLEINGIVADGPKIYVAFSDRWQVRVELNTH